MTRFTVYPRMMASLLAILLAAPSPAVAQEGLLSDGGDGGIEIEADALVAHYRDEGGSQIVYRLDAEGSVILTSNDSEASGDKAVYHLDRKVAVLVGDDLQLVTDRGTITAEESLEYWEDRSIAVARGDALVIQEDRRLKAGVLTAFIEPGDTEGQTRVTRIDATGGVHISTPTDIVTGQEGVYIVAEERVTLCGGVKITRDQNQLNGECAVVDMLTGRSTLQGKAGEKVRGLILRTE